VRNATYSCWKIPVKFTFPLVFTTNNLGVPTTKNPYSRSFHIVVGHAPSCGRTAAPPGASHVPPHTPIRQNTGTPRLTFPSSTGHGSPCVTMDFMQPWTLTPFVFFNNSQWADSAHRSRGWTEPRLLKKESSTRVRRSTTHLNETVVRDHIRRRRLMAADAHPVHHRAVQQRIQHKGPSLDNTP
jgi:hypothetical protein